MKKHFSDDEISALACCSATHFNDDSWAMEIDKPQWSTLEIANCREISLKLDSFGIETKVPLEYIDQVQEIEINGNRFVRVESKTREPIR